MKKFSGRILKILVGLGIFSVISGALFGESFLIWKAILRLNPTFSSLGILLGTFIKFVMFFLLLMGAVVTIALGLIGCMVWDAVFSKRVKKEQTLLFLWGTPIFSMLRLIRAAVFSKKVRTKQTKSRRK
jgi:hypothetical protein